MLVTIYYMKSVYRICLTVIGQKLLRLSCLKIPNKSKHAANTQTKHAARERVTNINNQPEKIFVWQGYDTAEIAPPFPAAENAPPFPQLRTPPPVPPFPLRYLPAVARPASLSQNTATRGNGSQAAHAASLSGNGGRNISAPSRLFIVDTRCSDRTC